MAKKAPAVKKRAPAVKKAAAAKKMPDAVLKELRAYGLALPGAHTKSPWPGHLDLAVNDKTFAYLSIEGEPFGISCKLPRSASVALMLPFCTPTSYGLGKSGWVTAQFPDNKPVPIDMLKEWLDESYRAQAPKKFLKQLERDALSLSSWSSRLRRSGGGTPSAPVTKPGKGKRTKQRVS